jgi:DNA replication protein DnaC
MKQLDAKLSQLRLHGMARSLQSLTETRQAQSLSFYDGLEIIIQAEEDERSNRKFQRLKKNAAFRYKSTIEQLHFDPGRGLDKNLIAKLATCDFIANGESVLISGATGCGKSYVASALGFQACSKGYKVAYYNILKLLSELKIARLSGQQVKLFDRLSKTHLLIIDDFGLSSWDAQQRMDMLEIIEDRHASNATIIASQIPISAWHQLIGESTIADAFLDRLVHTSHRIELKGESLRKKL